MRAYNPGILALAAVSLAFLAPPSLAANEIRIAVASNFRQAMNVVADRFEETSGHRVILIAGSTGKQYAQIVNGAPFDAFFAADVERPRALEAEKRIVPGSRFTYAIGKLVLWSADESLVDAKGNVLQSGSYRHLAIANPELAPYGVAARQVLQTLGLWDGLSDNLVRGENISQAFQFVVSGNAELGFIARAQLSIPGSDFAGSAWEPSQALYDPIEQQALLLRDTLAGRDFMTFMRSEEARALLRTYGYDVPDVQ